MSRPKQYDRTELLDRAVELFRRQGFNGTSTAELVSELGVNRKSMYAEFGSKQQLFEAVLEHYNENQLSRVLASLEATRRTKFSTSRIDWLSAMISRLRGSISSVMSLTVTTAPPTWPSS